MPIQTSSKRHLVYLRRTRIDAKRLVIYAAISALFAAASWALGLPRAVAYVLAAIGGYFALLACLNFLASLRHAKAVGTSEAAARNSAQAPIEEQEDIIHAGDTVRKMDLGGSHAIVRFVHLNNRGEAYEKCVETLYAAIDRDKARFFSRFAEFKTLNSQRYPDYADLIMELTIDHLLVLPLGRHGRCIARVNFVGELGEVWYAEYDGQSFSELFWA
jgi:hypothetical protein